MALSSRHNGHDHGSMADMDMGSGVFDNYLLQQQFWIFIGSVIAFAALVNVLDHILLYQRLKSKSAKPESIFWVSWATILALSRELYSASLPTFTVRGYSLYLPTLGPAFIVILYTLAVCLFWFLGTDPNDPWSWESISVRIGCINQAQLPLLFLLAGKQNVIGWVTGLTYERINWLHRWTARILWIGVTLHMGFFFRSWARWDYIKVKVVKDDMTQTGLAGWCILTAILLLSFAPVRRWNYELFLISHIVLFAGLIGAAMIHVMSGTEYIWACVAIFLFDRVARFIVALFCNLGFLVGRREIWANRATLSTVSGDVTRITIDNPTFKWKPGQHVFLSCHGIAPLQSHPFTIASLPSDGKLEFLVQARNGGTGRFHRWASKINLDVQREYKLVGLEGPYGHMRPLRQFDSIVLLAGSSGATFTVPLMRDIVQRFREGQQAVTRTIRFVWVIKSRQQLAWFQCQFERAISDVNALRQQGIEIELDISIYVTCDPKITVDHPSTPFEHQEGRGIATIVRSSEESNAVLEKSETVEIETASDGACDTKSTCCCRTTIEDEAANGIKTCCCSARPEANGRQASSLLPAVTARTKMATLTSSSSSSSSSSIQAKQQQQQQTELKILAGRPHTRNIIRKVLEEAIGESAVVVCGPRGLREDVRQSIVALSDERAVHKGTGAQGIYLHVEGFGY